jgi:rare lipoprotein A
MTKIINNNKQKNFGVRMFKVKEFACTFLRPLVSIFLLGLLSFYCVSLCSYNLIAYSMDVYIDSVNYISYKDSVDNIKRSCNKVSVNVSHGQATFYKGGSVRTANGDYFKPYTALTCAAHDKYPFGTILKVTNKSNGKSVVVKVNDRGKFYNYNGCENDIDLTHFAFGKISDHSKGRVNVKIEIIK